MDMHISYNAPLTEDKNDPSAVLFRLGIVIPSAVIVLSIVLSYLL